MDGVLWSMDGIMWLMDDRNGSMNTIIWDGDNRPLREIVKCNLGLFFNLSIKDLNDTYLNLITLYNKGIRLSQNQLFYTKVIFRRGLLIKAKCRSHKCREFLFRFTTFVASDFVL